MKLMTLDTKPRIKARIEAIVWVLIYAGMFCATLGIAVQRGGARFGWGLVAFGTTLIVAGAVLIWVRSRMTGDR